MTTLKALREENKKTAAEVATVLGVTESAISNYERGVRSIGLEQVLILAQQYGCSEKEIILAQLNSIRKSNKIIGRNI